jgi:hypothetical protein
LNRSPFLAEVPLAHIFDLVFYEPADLGADDIVVARPSGERCAQAAFGEARAIDGRIVEIADAVVPGLLHGRQRLVLGNRAKHVAERRAAKAKFARQNIF